ncbi:alpha/beta fold hydrolase [Loktanella sp. Alg231-35]|uniref:alpha/beta fold hydrolase n=1 Tax=Loktanella sp. Alg231-35 TaxID=1922220 RepID=UPI000D55D9AB|nr:alpha/beta fold hydrolase [Loktanella sp. Alg231-35]
MPKIAINGRQLHYQMAGSGPETILFSHGYLMSHRMFAAQIAALSQTYRVIAYDHRGHGESDACLTPFGIYDLVDDAAGLIDALCDGPAHFVGMSTGGYVGMRLLLKRPELINSLILIDTGAGAEDPASLKQYNQLLFFVRLLGIRPLLGKVLPLLMGPTFRTDPDRQIEFQSWKAYIGGLNKTSVRHFGRAVFDRDDVMDKLHALTKPPATLIMVGAEDIPTPPADAQTMHQAINGSQLVQVPDAGHTSPLEQPGFVSDAITAFLKSLE